MKNIIKCTLLILIINMLRPEKGVAQNLVFNPGFEQGVCPRYTGDMSSANFWGYAYNSYGSSDRLSTCTELQGQATSVPKNWFMNAYPHSGEAYAHAAVYPNDNLSETYYEYIQGQLMAPLTAGQCYQVEFWTRRTNNMGRSNSSVNFAVREVGLLLSASPLQQPVSNNPAKTRSSVINARPQIVHDDYLVTSDKWIKVSGTYRAKGGEKYVTLGCFLPDPKFGIDYIVAEPSQPHHKTRHGFAYAYDDISVTPIAVCDKSLYIEDKDYVSGPLEQEIARTFIYSGTDVGVPNVAGPVTARNGSKTDYIAGKAINFTPGFSALPNSNNGYFLAEVVSKPCGADTLPIIPIDAGDDFTYTCGDGNVIIGNGCIKPNDYHWHAEPAYASSWLNSSTICQPTLNIPISAFSSGLTSVTYTLSINEFSCSPEYDQITIQLDKGDIPIANAGNNILLYTDNQNCGGSCKKFNGLSESGVLYSWSPATGITNQSSPTSTVCYDPSLSYPIIYTLTASKANGCAISADQVEVDLIPATPLKSFNILSPTRELCTPGDCFDFGVNLYDDYYDYTWSVITAIKNNSHQNKAIALSYMTGKTTHPKFCQPQTGYGFIRYKLVIRNPNGICYNAKIIDINYADGTIFGAAKISYNTFGPYILPKIGISITSAPSKIRLVIKDGPSHSSPDFQTFEWNYGLDYNYSGFINWTHPDWKAATCNKKYYSYYMEYQKFCESSWTKVDNGANNNNFWVGEECNKKSLRTGNQETDVSLPILEKENGFHLYPNPTDGSFLIAIDNFELGQIYTTEVRDALGRVVLSEKITQGITQLNLSSMKSGLYMVTTFNNQISLTKRLIKN